MKKIRVGFTIYFTKLCISLLRLFKSGGTSLPGKIALKLYPNILREVSSGYKTIFITGTNGKTTTAKMIVNMIRSNGYDVITNDAGANMKTGITTCFIKNYKGQSQGGYAVIEIDEANLQLVSPEVEVSYLLITNIFRDQLDRYGEIYTTLAKIIEGVNDEQTVLILNGDEPLFNNIDLPNQKVFFGLELENDDEIDVNVEGKFCVRCKHPYSYNFLSYSHLGDYYCESCGYKRPTLAYSGTDVVQNKNSTSTFRYENKDINIKMSGLYNVYNAMSAITIAETIGLDMDKAIVSLEAEKSPFGRQEEVIIGDKAVKLMLVKNPAGYNQALDTLLAVDDNVTAGFLLNDNFADGQDVSWIFDVAFERVSGIVKHAYVGGVRSYDMAIRLNVSGVTKDKIEVFDSYNEFLELIEACEDDAVYVFLTYTAMMEFRRFLFDKKLIDKLY
ncbi:Mur ligase family protein [Mollicutes bacterium LVI A0039]|nr:Mur ligase family protein [Mollicutes bacterium LVI A0039]